MADNSIFKKLTSRNKNELKLPETTYIRDIENKVLQGIVLHSLSHIEDISLVHGNFINNFLGKDNLEGIKGIYTQQDNKQKSVTIKVEINIAYGIPIPDKAQEIQNRIIAEITRLTGLHVACVHVVFKNVIPRKESGDRENSAKEPSEA